VLVAFERTPQSHQGLWGVFVLEELETFPKLIHGIELCCAGGSVRCNCRGHRGPYILNVDGILI
jgi:hypothetical protein